MEGSYIFINQDNATIKKKKNGGQIMGGLVNHGMEFGFILWVSTGGSYFRKVVPTVLLRIDNGGIRVEGGAFST